ncbi:MAG TPA: phosphatase [Candidatus Merdenecus merdavium]|nr:phosphatase [Candidatus Merdenecus merdavium]
MRYILDAHTHSIASGHGSTDTITHMVKAAYERGLTLLGITEHGPATILSCKPSYFQGLATAPNHRCGIEVLYGAELNIMNVNGDLDLDDMISEKLDYVIAGLHGPLMVPSNAEDHLRAYIQAMKHPYVKVIAHCDDVRYPVDYEKLLQAAMEYGVILEINNSSLSPNGYRGNTKKNVRRILELCKAYDYPVLLSSDSHGKEHIGDFQYALPLIEETHFPEELILNTSTEYFKKYICR